MTTRRSFCGRIALGSIGLMVAAFSRNRIGINQRAFRGPNHIIACKTLEAWNVNKVYLNGEDITNTCFEVHQSEQWVKVYDKNSIARGDRWSSYYKKYGHVRVAWRPDAVV